ncbi:RTX toxin [Saccharibacillus sp. O23]|uniref:S-layer homology domain-containing protein n=1 Tax=Saccharibacillus sp. O23 TaxID=2009338 RepID=UPI000B4E4013|nr:S-layer homology domain-containing protein [Saccharibacillus sp. O23]OWR32566.1 RTX toxin [Saccharibacillus sp. O23]
MRSRLSKLVIATGMLTAAIGPNAESIRAAEARPAANPNSGFLDLANVPADQRQAILEAAELGFLTGGTDGRFRPQATLTRQELAVVLTRILKLDTGRTAASSFRDVSAQAWGSPYIEAAAKSGLMKGDGQHRFRANAPVTRQELAAVLVQAAKGAAIVTGEPISLRDGTQIGSWAEKAVRIALQNEWMQTEDGSFLPRQAVKRQDVANMFMETFYPDKHPNVTRTIQDVSDLGVTINGFTYSVSDRTKGILSRANRAALQGAKIRFEATGRHVDKITELELRRGGTAAAKGKKEFSGNLLLDGKQSIVDGNIKVANDYVSLANLTVTGNLEIGRELENDFYGRGIEVQGKTIVNGGDANTVVFDGSNLSAVDVNKTNVRVEALGQTFVQTVNANVDSTIVGAPAASIDQLNVTGAARQISLQGAVSSVNVNTASTIGGTANIGQMTVQTTSPVALNTTGTIGKLTVTQPNAAITVGSNLTVGSLSTPAGVAPGAVIANYAAAQPQIGSANGAASANTGPVNSPPVVRTPIKDFTMTLGEKKTIDLSQVFSDADGNLSYYKATLVKASSAPELVTATVDGNNLIIEAKLAGKITVRTQAYDTNNARVNHDFAVTVNRNPVAKNIPEQTATLDAAASTLDLSAYFSDPDGDPLTYKVVSADKTVVSASAVGKQLQLQAAALGQTKVTVTAEDGRGGTLTQEIAVRVNRSPQISAPLADRKASVGTNVQVDLSGAFQDPDGDPLTFEASSQTASAASTQINGSDLTITPLAEGPVSITVTAKDGKGGSAKQTFVLEVNHSPKLSQAIETQDMMVGKSEVLISLASAFSDADGDPLTYEVHSASPAIATAAFSPAYGDSVLLSPVSGGNTTVTVTANDGRGGKTDMTFDVRVNAAPTVKQAIGDRYVQLTGGDATIDLAGVFDDLNADPLTLSAESADLSVLQAAVVGTALKLTPLSAGSATIKLTADDGRGGQVDSSFAVRVNRAPQSSGSPADQLLTIGNGTRKVDVSGLFADLDGDALTFAASSSDAGVASVSVSGTEITVDPHAAGTTTVTVTASDGYGGKTDKTFDVVVNRSPIVARAVQDRLITLGSGDEAIDLSQVFRDEDGDALTLTASSLNIDLAFVSLNSASDTLTIRPLAGGTASIRLQADDGRGGKTEQIFKVTVNRAPQAGDLTDRTLSLGSVDRKIDVSGLFTDADGDALTLSTASDDDSVASASLSGNQLTLGAVSLGRTRVTVTASDSRGGQSSKTFEVEVRPNQAPVVAQTIAAQSVQPGKTVEVDLANVFGDPDEDALTYQAVSADTSAASVSVSGQKLNVTGVADGTSVITVTATDAAGNKIDTVFTVTVLSNEAPVVIGSVPEQLVVSGFGTQFAVDSLFRDDDGDPLTYSAQAADGKVAAIVDGNLLKLSSGIGGGKTSVTVTADDGRGGKTSTTVQVNAAELVHQKTIATKTGIANVSYDLAPYFPAQQPFTVYRAENGTLVRENAPVLSGNTLNMVPGSTPGIVSYVVVSADGKAASVQLDVRSQQGAAAFFSEYSRETSANIVLEMYNLNEDNLNYQIIGYRYNLQTGQMERMLDRDYKPNSQANVMGIYKGNTGLVINNVFYEFMDRSQVAGYHDELVMNLDWNYKFDGYIVCAFELVENGQVIDVLGDKNWTPASGAKPLTTNGTLIRKKGVATGSSAFNLNGEWDLLPFTLNNVAKHTP